MAKMSCAFLFLLAASLFGCASTAVIEPPIVYPSPPEEPRIVYLKSYKGRIDFRKKSIFDAIFGVQVISDFKKPYGVSAFDGRIYVTETQYAGVAIFDTKQETVKLTGDFALPIGVAALPDGGYFVSDSKQKRVFGYDQNVNLRVAIGKKDEFKNPAGLAVNNDLKRLYVVDSYGHSVHVYSVQGEKLFQFGKDGDGDGDFHYPSNVAIDRRNGNVVVVDTQNFRVQIFDKDGKFIRKFGQLGDALGTFSRPKGVGVDSEGHIYVADAAFDNFQVFDENGQLLIFIGGAGNKPGYFQLPAGLFVDEQDKIYVVDSLNARVQVFQYLSEKWKKEHPQEYQSYLLPAPSEETKETVKETKESVKK